MKAAVGECGFDFCYGRSGYSLAAPTLRCVYPVCFTTRLNDIRVHSFVLEHLVVPMDCAAQNDWIQSPAIFFIILESDSFGGLQISQFLICPQPDVVVNERGFHNLLVFSRVVQKVHRVCDATVHVVPIAIEVLANQSSVRCEQLFNTGPLNLDGDVRHGKSAVLACKPGLLNWITLKLISGGPRTQIHRGPQAAV